MVKKIPLQNGYFALVDDDDFEKLNQYVWTIQRTNNTGYIVCSHINNKTIQLSRFLTDAKHKECVYFKDGNYLNFQKNNLYIGEKRDSLLKRRGNAKSSSKYKGVSWVKARGKWRACIKIDGKNIYLGQYLNEDDAGRAYNDAVLKYFGDIGYLNVIGEDNSATIIDEIKKSTQHRKPSKLGYKGVFMKGERFGAQIWDGKRMIHLGLYETLEKALKIYDQKAYEIHGDEAILNYPDRINDYKKSLEGDSG